MVLAHVTDSPLTEVDITLESQVQGGLLSQVSNCCELSHAVRTTLQETGELFWQGASTLSH